MPDCVAHQSFVTAREYARGRLAKLPVWTAVFATYAENRQYTAMPGAAQRSDVRAREVEQRAAARQEKVTPRPNGRERR